MGRSIIKKAIESKEFDKLEDGYFYWFPRKDKGGLSEQDLREIADHLDKINAEHHASLGEFFSKHNLK